MTHATYHMLHMISYISDELYDGNFWFEWSRFNWLIELSEFSWQKIQLAHSQRINSLKKCLGKNILTDRIGL